MGYDTLPYIIFRRDSDRGGKLPRTTQIMKRERENMRFIASSSSVEVDRYSTL